MSYREFESVTGISHATIRRLELCEVKSPDFATLAKLSPHTAYSASELNEIARNQPSEPIRKFRVAEDVKPMVDELPDTEVARLIQMVLGRLVGQNSS